MIIPGNRRARRRRGAVMLEGAIVYNVAIMLTLGTIIMGLGIFRYQEVAWLAREGSRWASVHGPKYQAEKNAAAPTSADVMTNAITPRAVILNASNLACTLSMANGSATVTVTYNWTPEAFWAPITFSSASATMITY